jgi:BirA family transcriptional regulator, biotin operon repressor / biotin---[acetyl-CoA-carboxylase] ligase
VDLTGEALAAVLPDRAARCYPALVSTQAEAMAWARAGAPAGAVVAADYQASPRGRGGLEWQTPPGESLGFSLVLRPRLPAPREGWLYVAATCGLADVVDGRIEWPDEVQHDGRRAGAIGVHVELGAVTTEWAVVSVVVADVTPPRAPLLAQLVTAIETRCDSPTTPVLADFLRRCNTIGRDVRARMIPLGPGGAVVTGKAMRVLTDGALVLEQEDGRGIAVRPQNLGLLEDA